MGIRPEYEQFLLKHHLNMSLAKLARGMKRSKRKVFEYIRHYEKMHPGALDAERICIFDKSLKRIERKRGKNYRERNREKINAWGREVRRAQRITREFLLKQREWTAWDTFLLANTYFKKNYRELLEIFAIKTISVEKRLRQLCNDDFDSWDEERIGELEREAEAMPPLDKTKLRGYFASVAHLQGRRLREEIDELIELENNGNEIARKLKISRQAVSAYILDRGLKEWYELMINNNGTGN